MGAAGGGVRAWAGLSRVGVVAAVLFAGWAVAVMRGDLVGFDDAVRGAVHGWAGAGVTGFAEGVTWLGTLGVLALIGAGLLVWCVRGGRREEAAVLGVVMAVAIVVENALKFGLRRARPIPFFGVDPVTYSFPSGHSLFSLCFYGTLGVFAWRRGHRAVAGGLLVLVGVIGWSRVYLGVHYPSDVVGGIWWRPR